MPSAFHPEGFESFDIIWLRTCYDIDAGERHQELLDKLDIVLALDVEQNVLDDQTIYDYGDDWSRIFEVMPERLFCIAGASDSIGFMREVEDGDAKIRQCKIDVEAGEFESLRMEEASRSHLPGKHRPETDDEIEASIYRAKTHRLHHASIVNYLFIADKEAMETGKVLIVFFDDRGRSVRQARIQPDLCEDTAGARADGHFADQPELNEAYIGPEYLPGGACGLPFPTVSSAAEARSTQRD